MLAAVPEDEDEEPLTNVFARNSTVNIEPEALELIPPRKPKVPKIEREDTVDVESLGSDSEEEHYKRPMGGAGMRKAIGKRLCNRFLGSIKRVKSPTKSKSSTWSRL
jgi:hypothetical protein